MSDEIRLEIYGEDVRPTEQDTMAQALRHELLQIQEVDGVVPAQAGPAPPGSKAVGLAAVGALVVSIQPTVELVEKVLKVVRAWLDRKPAGPAPTSMRVTINGQVLDFVPTEKQKDEVLRAYITAALAGGGASSG